MYKNIKNICISALFLALCLILPIFTSQLKEIGKMLLPMHLPVLLCGMIVGPIYGFIVGIVSPILRSITFGMPRFYPDSIYMACELATYGFISGILIVKFKDKKILGIYISLILSMIIGRVILCVAEVILLGTSGGQFAISVFLTKSILSGVPGIILQLILIPMLIIILNKSNKET